ncbi:hypothetical protein Fot_04063 [Forsythia ovata]|uniref:Uncharacterized protein n=1 Tax=Forsythia ovata TaxID=205694 RepID=A0ABD1XBM5_9LAMI
MAENICELEGKTDENEVEKQIEFPEDSDFNPKRLRDETHEIVVSEGGEILKKKRNMHHKKMSIAQTVSNLAEQVQMLVQENRARVTLSSGRIADDEKMGVETRIPAASHSHPYSVPRDFRRYQPVDPLKERERRPTRSSSVFDWLGDEADFHQRKTPFHDSRRAGLHLKDPMYEPDYSYDDESDGPTRQYPPS